MEAPNLVVQPSGGGHRNKERRLIKEIIQKK